MKSLLVSSSALSVLTTLTVLSNSQAVKAFNLEACSKDPIISKPQVINLLQPLDQKFLNCIPDLSSTASKWRGQANKITSATNRFKIGNNGKSRVEKLEYNLAGNYITFVVSAKAAHTWKVPAVREQVPVDKWRWVEKKVCVLGRCKTFKEKVPYVEMEWRTITPETSASASATCNYSYTFNISTGESKPIFNCGKGALGGVKLDASAVTAVLRGEMPTMGSLVSAFDFTPPLFKDESWDEYHNVRNNMLSRHQGSYVYFSSESFVNWASAKNHLGNGIVAVLSGGSYSAELIRQIEEKLRTELTFMGTFASQTAIQLGTEQIVSMMTRSGNMNLNGFDVSVKVVNTPEITQKCMIQPRRVCPPAIELPRMGFAIIATRSK